MVARTAGFKRGAEPRRSAAARDPGGGKEAEAVAKQRHQVLELVDQLNDAFHRTLDRAQRRGVPEPLVPEPLVPGLSSGSAAKVPRTFSAQDL